MIDAWESSFLEITKYEMDKMDLREAGYEDRKLMEHGNGSLPCPMAKYGIRRIEP
jgi:hypothetical protein